MSSSLFKSCCVFLTVLALSEALKCHQCKGSDEMPSAISSIMTNLNANNVTMCDSDCTAESFCLKVASIYTSTVGGKTYHHTTYTKTCSALTVITPYGSNETKITSGVCYQGTPGGKTGDPVTGTTQWCFCNSDYCNGVDARTGGVISVVLSVIALLASY
uniref:Protein quiver n=1 Tax=Plectus sambesii TaxID=2011161 RepID=A0A914XH64_9BILA